MQRPRIMMRCFLITLLNAPPPEAGTRLDLLVPPDPHPHSTQDQITPEFCIALVQLGINPYPLTQTEEVDGHRTLESRPIVEWCGFPPKNSQPHNLQCWQKYSGRI